MSLQWMFLLLLIPLLAAQNRHNTSPNNFGKPLGKEGCQRPPWDSRLQLEPDQENYEKNKKVKLSCPKGFQPTYTEIKCQSAVQHSDDYVMPYSASQTFWHGRGSRGVWVPIQSSVECIEMCQRPPWDSRLRLEPDQENYEKNKKVKLSCPKGFQPTYTEIKCQSGVQEYGDYVTPYSASQAFWHGRDSRGVWVPNLSSVECIEVLQVDPQSFEISSTSIKLKWTCRFPDACQGMRAMCQLAAPSSPPCQAEEVKAEQMLHGQEGTVTCSPLQPFTNYSVTIYLPPNTTLFSQLLMTEQTVSGLPLGPWPESAVIVVVLLLLLLILLSAGILWFVFCRKKKALPSKAEEDHYTELQPYENAPGDNYCVIKTFLEKDAGEPKQ